jgi:hypothetical protein
MRFASILCLTLSILGCSENFTQRSPTVPTSPVTPSPQPTSPQPASPQRPAPPPYDKVVLWGFVVNPSGECIKGATVEVIDLVLRPHTLSEPPRYLLGQKATQPCESPILGGGFGFDDGAPPDVEVHLRASAPGYVSKVQIIIPYSETIDRTITLVPTGR